MLLYSVYKVLWEGSEVSELFHPVEVRDGMESSNVRTGSSGRVLVLRIPQIKNKEFPR